MNEFTHTHTHTISHQGTAGPHTVSPGLLGWVGLMWEWCGTLL